ncbi:hypothetical protein HDU80_008686 [Chytriomyces hyalinus]|nr:hypothetical protein HDU80_008686 [Chytriomyces hyalinus]
MNATTAIHGTYLQGYWDWKVAIISLGISFTGSVSGILFNEMKGRSECNAFTVKPAAVLIEPYLQLRSDPPISPLYSHALLFLSAFSISVRAIFMMHFVGMTAFPLFHPNGMRVPMFFDPVLTMISAVVCLVVVLGAFHFASHDAHWNDIIEERMKLVQRIYAKSEAKRLGLKRKKKAKNVTKSSHQQQQPLLLKTAKMMSPVKNKNQASVPSEDHRPHSSSRPDSSEDENGPSENSVQQETEAIAENNTPFETNALVDPAMHFTKFDLQIMILFDRPWRILVSGIFVGLAVLCMHHLGIHSIRMEASYEFDMGLVVLSALIAVVAATVGMFIIFRVQPYYPHDNVKVIASIVIAIAVNGMHYTGMAALRYTYAPDPNFNTAGLIDGSILVKYMLYLEIVFKVVSEVMVRRDMTATILLLRARVKAAGSSISQSGKSGASSKGASSRGGTPSSPSIRSGGFQQ